MDRRAFGMPSLRHFFARLHRDQQGSISVLSVFAVLLLTMLLGMVMNVGRHVDSKVRMQNAADAAAYSGGVVIARGLNTLTFSNRLLFDVFALTAFMREARDRNAEKYVPEIIEAWRSEAGKFIKSGFPKFERLGPAIMAKVPMEQELVRAFCDWGAAVSQRALPVLEEILRAEMIPQFQRAVVQTYPVMAQMAAQEVALRNTAPDNGRGPLLAALWRTDVVLVGADELANRTLAVADPAMDASGEPEGLLGEAREQREHWAKEYLGVEGPVHWDHSWNDQTLWFFETEAKMSRFASLWRRFTCGYLEQLLNEEYPTSNLPHLIRDGKATGLLPEAYLDRYFTFVGVVYWRRLPEMLPGLFSSPIRGDALAFSEVRVFVPHRRLEWQHLVPTTPETPIGGMPGNFPPLPPPPGSEEPTPPAERGSGRWVIARQGGISTRWDLLNQHWTVQLVPVAAPQLAQILQTQPALPQFAAANIQLPSLGNLSTADMGRLISH